MHSVYKLIIQKPAQIDLDEAFIWHEEKSDGLGFRLMEDFEETISKIFANPFYASKVNEELRAASLQKFPYEIIYAIDTKHFIIAIVVFNHFKREPLWYKSRL